MNRPSRERTAVKMAIAIVIAVASPHAQAQLHAAIEHEDEPRIDPAELESQPPTTKDDHKTVDHAALHGTHAADENTQTDATGHVAPAPPQQSMSAMPAAQMIDVMGMDDDATFGSFTLDRFERVKTDDGDATAWNAEGWLGGDFDKVWLKSEGSSEHGSVEHADAQLLWSHAVAPYWDTQVGVREDFGQGPDRSWAAFGVQGLAPYWFELSATAYVGQQGRTALRIESEYDLLLSQRLILQPRFELNAYGRADPELGIGAGLSDAEFGLRLRYEIRREIAPYIGIEWRRSFAATADLARMLDRSVFDAQVVAGIRLWF